MKALAKDRDQRFQTMKEMALALEACAGGDVGAGVGQRAVGHRRRAARAVAGVPHAGTPVAPPRAPAPPDAGPRAAAGARTGLVVAASSALLVAGGGGGWWC